MSSIVYNFPSTFSDSLHGPSIKALLLFYISALTLAILQFTSPAMAKAAVPKVFRMWNKTSEAESDSEKDN